MKILVTGGAGYIGSHVVKALGLANQHEIIIYDNLSTGYKESVTFGRLIVGDLEDAKKLEELFSEFRFDAVFHFAGSIIVPESVSNPSKYYQNNTVNSLTLLSLCEKYKVRNFIFSSTAAVYGLPKDGICSEHSELKPINPYGQSKLMTEFMLKDLSVSSNINFVILRYFNVCGADLDGQIGQSFPQATHLIKVACETAIGKRSRIDIFGTDYPTPDGTCIRDYIHVSDLADAHVKALEYLECGGRSEILNCGYGHGFSVKEVVARVKELTGVDFKVVESDRRPGDPASITAKVDRIQSVLGWKPKYNNLNTIIKSAYEWEKNKRY